MSDKAIPAKSIWRPIGIISGFGSAILSISTWMGDRFLASAPGLVAVMPRCLRWAISVSAGQLNTSTSIDYVSNLDNIIDTRDDAVMSREWEDWGSDEGFLSGGDEDRDWMEFESWGSVAEKSLPWMFPAALVVTILCWLSPWTAIAAFFVGLGCWWIRRFYRIRKAVSAVEHEQRLELACAADEQHRQIQAGDMAGIYGRYPPPDATRGLGVWLCGTPSTQSALQDVAGDILTTEPGIPPGSER